MKVIFAILTFLFLFKSRVISQTATHTSIENFALQFEDANPKEVSKVIDSPNVVIYVVQLKKEISVNNICVRISSAGSTEGNLMMTKFKYNSEPIYNEQKQLMYMRKDNVVYIRTVTTNKVSELNMEVYTEDVEGKSSPALNWKK